MVDKAAAHVYNRRVPCSIAGVANPAKNQSRSVCFAQTFVLHKPTAKPCSSNALRQTSSQITRLDDVTGNAPTAFRPSHGATRCFALNQRKPRTQQVSCQPIGVRYARN